MRKQPYLRYWRLLMFGILWQGYLLGRFTFRQLGALLESRGSGRPIHLSADLFHWFAEETFLTFAAWAAALYAGGKIGDGGRARRWWWPWG